MRAKKSSRVLSLVLSAVMLLALLPAVSGTAAAAVTEQFPQLPIGKTYYFDLSSEIGNIGTVNTGNTGDNAYPGVPDASLHYVPFTYVGTVNAYSLEPKDDKVRTTVERANARLADRSLFVADYNVSHLTSWDTLNTNKLIYGKTFNTNYKLRSLSVGSFWANKVALNFHEDGTPTTNEWDSILRKSGLKDPIKNWSNINSWGQDSIGDDDAYRSRAVRGAQSLSAWNGYFGRGNFAWRPALEVINGTGLKAIEFDLNGGHFATDATATSMSFAYTGDGYTVREIPNLARPTDSTGTYFKWNTKVTGDGESYAVGDIVPNSVTTLYAQWKKPIPEGARYDVVGGTGSGSRLERSLNVEVTDPAAGITATDKANGNKVSLKLTVAEKAAAGTPDGEKIEGVKQGDIVQYYDVKVEKTVTPPGGETTTTVLTSIPKPVQAVIPVPSAIQGKTSYTVYRVHNGKADKIPNDPTALEFYTVNPGGTSLTLHVSKFSTYAVITGGKSLTGDVTFGDAKNPKTSDMDVQGKVLEGMFGVYKLDISWGAMKFDYNSKGMVWNPVTHSYDATPGSEGWTNESFEAGNNKITVANHSNGDVTLYYAANPEAALAGATMTVRAQNSLGSVLAENLLLAKVPTETAAAPTVDAYVWLDGKPTTFASKTYTKAGVITITAEPDTAGGLTPKTATP